MHQKDSMRLSCKKLHAYERTAPQDNPSHHSLNPESYVALKAKSKACDSIISHSAYQLYAGGSYKLPLLDAYLIRVQDR